MIWNQGKVDLEKLPYHIKDKLVAYLTDKVSAQDATSAARDKAYKRMETMTPQEIVDMWLLEEGIVGYTHQIINLVLDVQNATIVAGPIVTSRIADRAKRKL